MRNASIVLLSGGLDSVYAFVKAHEETDILYAITFDYGQRAVKNEIAVAKMLCEFYDIAHKVIDLGFFAGLTSHPLLNANKDLPTLTAAQLDSKIHAQQSANAVWLPNRNGVFLNVAAALAEAGLADRIYVGFNAEEGATFPDNSAAFITASNKAFSFSTQNHVEIVAPAAKLHKKDIVKELAAIDFDFSQIWSCYSGGKKMCGQCESCLRLRRAFVENNLVSIEKELFM